MKKKFTSVPVRTGDEIEVKVSGLAYGGDGVAKYKNFTIFIPYSVPKDLLFAVVEIVKKNYARASVKKTLEDSPDFTVPGCPDFKKCGGCQWLNIKYNCQAEYKTNILKSMLAEEAGKKIKKIISPADPFYYRNRAQYKVAAGQKKIKLGFYAPKSHNVRDTGECLLVKKEINNIAMHTRDFLNIHKKKVVVYNEKTKNGYLRGVGVRVNKKGRVLVTFIVAKEKAEDYLYKYPEYLKKWPCDVAGVTINFNTKDTNRVFGKKEKVIYGSDVLNEEAGGLNFRLSSSSFFQVNTEMLEEMAAFVRKNTDENSRVLDIYGGVGALSLPLWEKAKEITIIESDEKAAESARDAVKTNNIINAEIINSQAETETGKIIKAKNIDTVILDPPRKGVHPRVLNALKQQKPKKIIYISCNPSTYARDINILSQLYEPSEIIPIDLFPHTYHIETMSCLRLKQYEGQQAGSRISRTS